MLKISDKIVVYNSARLYGKTEIGKGSIIMENVIIGHPTTKVLSQSIEAKKDIENFDFNGAIIGDEALVRSNSVIYCNTKIGDNLKTGHNIVIREDTSIGKNVLVGTNVVIDGNSKIGKNVSIQSNVYIPINTEIEDNVFLGPNVVLTNDKYPIREDYTLKGPIIRKGASIGANSTILPGIEVGEGAMVAAGALVTKDVPKWSLAIGQPAKIDKLSKELKVLNRI